MAYRGTRQGKAKAKSARTGPQDSSMELLPPSEVGDTQPPVSATPQEQGSRGVGSPPRGSMERASTGSLRSNLSSRASDVLSLDNLDLALSNSEMWEVPQGEQNAGTPQQKEAVDKEWMSEAIRKGVEVAMQAMANKPTAKAGEQGAPNKAPGPCHSYGGGSSIDQSQSAGDPLMDLEEGQIQEDSLLEDQSERQLSEDEGLDPDPPVSVGLFQPALFRSLLHKAKLTAGLGTAPPEPQASSSQVDPFFEQGTIQEDVVPSPKLFLEAIDKQWVHPSAGPLPNSLDKKFFNVSQEMAQRLQIPKVDPPVLALFANAQMPGEPEDLLRPEERRTEMALQRAHQSAAWAVKATTTAAFFSRTMLRWLSALKERVPQSDTRGQQDMNKMLAAERFIADATLQAARFAARSMGSSMVARRLNWLKNWSGDAKHKWKLAAAPLSGQSLFGAALEPIVVETKDKRKVLPTRTRRAEARPTPFPRRAYRPPEQPGGRFPAYQAPRPRYGGERGRRGSTSRRPFRGTGGRPYRRNR